MTSMCRRACAVVALLAVVGGLHAAAPMLPDDALNEVEHGKLASTDSSATVVDARGHWAKCTPEQVEANPDCRANGNFGYRLLAGTPPPPEAKASASSSHAAATATITKKDLPSTAKAHPPSAPTLASSRATSPTVAPTSPPSTATPHVATTSALPSPTPGRSTPLQAATTASATASTTASATTAAAAPVQTSPPAPIAVQQSTAPAAANGVSGVRATETVHSVAAASSPRLEATTMKVITAVQAATTTVQDATSVQEVVTTVREATVQHTATTPTKDAATTPAATTIKAGAMSGSTKTAPATTSSKAVDTVTAASATLPATPVSAAPAGTKPPSTTTTVTALHAETSAKPPLSDKTTSSSTMSPPGAFDVRDKQPATSPTPVPPVAVVRTELGSTTIMSTEDDAMEEDGAGLHGDVLEDGEDVLLADAPLGPYMVEAPHFPDDLDARLANLNCAVSPLPPQSVLWRTNQTHELELPITVPLDCVGPDCPPAALGWESSVSMQSGDVMLVRIDVKPLEAEAAPPASPTASALHPQEAVYGVSRAEMAACDVGQGLLLDITPLLVDGKLLLALYDKDLSDGDNFLVILSERWAPGRCIKLHVLMKSDNCGENQDCSTKGVCFSRDGMDGFECQCCPGFLGPHCEERDACFPSPCLNQGICLDVSQGRDDDQYSCLCPYGFTGTRCEVVTDPCESEPCKNGGTCRRNGTEWACACPEDFRGVQCERGVAVAVAVAVQQAAEEAGQHAQHAPSPCAPSPCKYGVCVNKGGEAACYCQPGFAGKRCDMQFRMCGSMPCLNGGECVDVVDGFTCKCGRGYRGERCETKVPLCRADSCPPGRTCRDLGNNVTCGCPAGTTLPDCTPTPPPPRPCSRSPCRHGGTCYNSDGGFYCACRPGYTGPTCNVEEAVLEEIPVEAAQMAAITSSQDYAPHPSHLHLHSVYVGAITLACALLIVVVTVTACHCRVHETYKRCLVLPCSVVDMEDPLANLPLHKSTRGKPLLDSLKEPLTPSPTSKTAPLLECDMYYAMDLSDSQSSPLIVQPPRFLCPLDRADRVRM